MVYCISDVHGETERFQRMLSLIKFSEQDTLYILGDVIDRKPGGVELLKRIINAPNIVMILGNHEKMCIETLGPNAVPGTQEVWFRNGGDITCRELACQGTDSERRHILDYLAGLPSCLDIEVKGQSYHLVHGFPAESAEGRVWGRPTPDSKRPFPNKVAIIGHTPTCRLTKDADSPYRIWHGDGIYDIDCGCGGSSEHRRLACLRLDDMAEFYV